jgi:hypothetical protein
MLWVEHKGSQGIHGGAEKKSLRFINNKFTLNMKIGALLLMMRKITISVKFGEKY